MDRFRSMAYQVSRNHMRTCWVLKLDVKQFFASIDQEVLMQILRRSIRDKDVLWLLDRIVSSFSSGNPGVGLPLGNLTSQLLVNVYMNVFDQFVRHRLKGRHYLRYADDCALLSHDRPWLMAQLPMMRTFLREKLHLDLHPDKTMIQTFASGVDFLGWVHFPTHQALRTSTKKRMFRRLRGSPKEEVVASYLGLLSHGNAHKLSCRIAKTASI